MIEDSRFGGGGAGFSDDVGYQGDGIEDDISISSNRSQGAELAVG